MDLGKTQAEWNALYKVLGAEVQVLDALEAAWARCSKVRSPVEVQLDEQGVYAGFDLGGQAVVGGNTDADGKLYVNFSIVGNCSTQVFKDSALGGADLVASGETISGVSTQLNEKNASGFTDLFADLNSGPPAGFVADADIVLELSQDFDKLLGDAYLGDGDEALDQSKTESKERLAARIATQLAVLHERRWDDVESKVLLGYVSDFLQLTDEDEDEGAGVEYVYDTTTIAGQVLIRDRLGVAAALRLSMQEETVGGAQSVAQATKASGNLVAISTNVGGLLGEGTPAAGAGALTLALAENCFSGTLHLRCVQDTPGATKLSVQNTLTDPFAQAMEDQDSTERVVADNQATVAKRFQDGPTGFDFTANYKAPVEAGDDGNMLSGVTIGSLSQGDCDFGKSYWRVTRTKTTALDGSDEFDISVYSNSARTNLRGSQTFAAIVGTAAVAITCSAAMAIAGTFHQANANVKLPNKNDYDDIEYDLDIPRVGDRWTVAITVTHASRLSRKLAQLTGVALPASGSPTVTEGYSAYHPILEP